MLIYVKLANRDKVGINSSDITSLQLADSFSILIYFVYFMSSLDLHNICCGINKGFRNNQ
jgi:hypothetical protein